MKLRLALDGRAMMRANVTEEQYRQIETAKNETCQQEFEEIQILADNGRTLFALRLDAAGVMEINTVMMPCTHNGVMLDSAFAVLPQGSCQVRIRREVLPGKETSVNKLAFIDQLAAALATADHLPFEQLTQECQLAYASAAIKTLAALEQMGDNEKENIDAL